jgi:cytochrome c553
MKTHLFGVLTAFLCFASAAPTVAAEGEVAPKLLSLCESCHGTKGISARRDVPRLNGQKSEYILLRMAELGDPSRNTPHAAPMTKFGALSAAETMALARYFSSQPPTRPIGVRLEAKTGEALFKSGSEYVPSCAACHGLAGEGYRTTPRLAGQHEFYLRNQIQAFRSGARTSTEMNSHAWNLSLQQTLDLMAYLSNQ